MTPVSECVVGAIIPEGVVRALVSKDVIRAAIHEDVVVAVISKDVIRAVIPEGVVFTVISKSIAVAVGTKETIIIKLLYIEIYTLFNNIRINIIRYTQGRICKLTC